MKTCIPGKDESLEDAISRMQRQLLEIGFHIEEHSWLNPLPHVWSVHIRDRDCPLLFTNGKGASRKAALASALGEFFERLATHYFWADYYLGDAFASAERVHYPDEKWFVVKEAGQWPEGLLDPQLIDFYAAGHHLQPQELVDINSAQAGRGICALPFTRQRDQQRIYFPVNIIGNLYVSNGMSAGNTVHEARVQALSEILERHVKFTIIAEGLCLPDIPAEQLRQYPKITAGIQKLEQAGFGVWVKDASLGGKYPVVNVTLLNPENQGCYASFGAHPRFEVALERSLTELLQGRELGKLNDFPPPSMEPEEVASPENLETHFIDSSGLIGWPFLANTPDFACQPCDFRGETRAEFTWLCDLIHGTGRDIYIADYPHLGTYACRILVPSMSEIYACEDLIWENNNQGIELREDLLKLTQLTPSSANNLLQAIEKKGFDDLLPVASLVGLPMDAGTLWSDFRVAELKTLLAAITGELPLLQQGCEWLLGFGQLAASRKRLYHCVQTLLQMGEKQTQYTHALHKLYPQATLEQARALLAGKLQGFDFGNQAHQQLIAAYGKVYRQHSSPGF